MVELDVINMSKHIQAMRNANCIISQLSFTKDVVVSVYILQIQIHPSPPQDKVTFLCATFDRPLY
jgi:hypothetical protein